MSQFIEMFGGETNKVPLEEIVIVKDDCRKPINEGVRSEMKDGELYPYYGATGVVDYINDYLTDDELLCIAEDCGNYNAGEESAYIIRDKAWVNNHAHLVKTKETCDIKYLYYFLKIADLKPYVSGTTRLKLTQKKLKEISVTLPSINMQKSFVEIAEQADKSEFVGFKSQFIEMFKDENLVPLGNICNIEKGATITRNDVQPGNIPVVAGGQEPSCYHNISNREAGAITVSASGAYAGYINFWNCPIFASDCNTIIPKDVESIDQTFIYFGLKAMQQQIYGLQKGGAQPHVYGKDLQKFLFPNPPYTKQIVFSEIAKQADKSKFPGI